MHTQTISPNIGPGLDPKSLYYVCSPVLFEPRIIERIVTIIKKQMPDYDRRFYSGSEVGEYYGRGQLEGLALGLYGIYDLLSDNSKAKVRERLTPNEWAYFEVWVEERLKECLNPKVSDDE